MKTGTKRLIIIIAVLAVIAVVVAAAALRGDGTDNAVTVDYHRTETASMEEKISASGSFTPETTSTVYGKVSGSVISLSVSEGDAVRIGQVLMTIDQEDYLQAVKNSEVALESVRRGALQNLLTLRSAYESASLAHSQALRTVENNRELYNAQGISEEALKTSEEAFTTTVLNLKSALERLNLTVGIPLDSDPVLDDNGDEEIIAGLPEVVQAELAVDTAKKNLSYCSPSSPIRGVVTQILVSEGDLTGPNSPLVKIEDLDAMMAEIQIDEVDIGKIHVGDTAAITSDSLLGTTLSGRVKSISPVIQRVGNTRMSQVDIAIDPSEHTLKSGASCTARIAITTKDSALVIPLTAYITKDDVSKVFVLTKDTESGTDADPGADMGQDTYTMNERIIETGIMTVNSVEVLSGLEEGDIIAMGNQTLYRDGLSCVLGEEK